MIRGNSSLWLVLSITILASGLAAAVEEGAFFKAGFDSEREAKWAKWQRGKGSFGWTADQGHAKAGALVMDVQGSGREKMSYYKDVPVVGRKNILVRVWCKSEAFSGRALVSVRWKDADKKFLTDTRLTAGTKPQNVGAEWQECSLQAQVPDNAASAIVYLTVYAAESGKVFFDDVEILDAPPSPEGAGTKTPAAGDQEGDGE